MLPLLLGISLLIASWALAHLLAVATDRLARRNGFRTRLTDVTPHITSTGINRKIARTVYFILLMLMAGVALAISTGIEPVSQALLDRLQRRVDLGLTSQVLVLLLDYQLLFLGVFIAFQTIKIINSFFPKLYLHIDSWRHSRFRVIKLQSLELLTPDQLADFLILLARYIRAGLILLVGSLAVTLIFSFFPETEGLVRAASHKVVSVLDAAWQQVLAFGPNLVTLLLIGVLTRYMLKLLRFFSEGFRNGKIKHSRFHPDLAEPTYQLARFFVIALAIVAAFPYIPGSDSVAFRGISIFIGFLLSLGSTSLVTNMVSGVVLTYTRGLNIGDRVQIGDAVWDVIERTLLVTRIRTIKNVEITIPNGEVINNHIINYSTSACESGLILHTEVTIGYDVPWRQIHELLVHSALDTPDILEFPRPFVLQTGLQDYAVSYELNAYTMVPQKMATIYSQLHQNIQDQFNEAEIEILSPAYTALRDGNQASIPNEYLPHNYIPPVFRTSNSTNGRADQSR